MNMSLRAIAVAAIAVSGAQAQLAIDAKPQPGAAAGSERWIVTFKSRPFDLHPLQAAIAARAEAAAVADLVAGLEAQAVASHAALAAFVAAHDGVVTKHWWIIDACAVEIAASQVGALRAHDQVAGMFPDTLRAPANFDLIRDATNSRNHNSDLVNQVGFKGAGVTLAIADSGCDENMAGAFRPHATFFVNGDINNRTGGGLGGSRLLVNRQMGSQSPDDIISHGTPVAACAAGQVWPNPAGDPGQAPEAKIASYSMCDTANGFALLSTMISTWQRIASDTASLGIRVANLSYQGTSYIEWPEQLAMDVAAQVADIAVAVMGGNDPHYAHAALNVLAVGSVTTNTRTVSLFSALGPLETDPARFMPDLVANGESLTMPQADAETGNRVASGTSYASPQVAGAMAIYRSIRTTATSLETRAAVIASSDAIGDQNRQTALHSRNGYGLGYLRTDRLAVLALDPNTLSTTLLVTTQQPTVRARYRVTAGAWYVAALACNRQDANANTMDYSNLDLTVSLNGTVLGVADTPRNVHERVIFKAPATGVVDIDVRAVHFEANQAAVAFGLVAGASQPAYREGSMTAFGSFCGPTFPRISGSLVASVGTTYFLSLSISTTAPTRGVLLYGASDQLWGSVRLPLALAGFGAPGCTLYASPDVALPILLVGGSAGVPTAVPNDRALVGASLFHQMALVSPANALGVVFSHALRATIAGFLP